MASPRDSLLQDEITALQSIYLPEELEVKNERKRSCEIVATLHPYTAENEDEKYVSMQLVIKVGKDYPFSKPAFDIKMPRGISDNQLDSILLNLDGLASHRLGEEMLFTLIEYAKECLTNNNRPECPCSICLDVFEEDDNFIRTDCFHFFHEICMARHVKSYTENIASKTNHPPFENQEETNANLIPCPVCRTVLSRDSLKLDGVDTTEYTSEKTPFEPSEKYLIWRKQMEVLFRRQQKRGGIIDVEAEKNKFLIETRTQEKRSSEGQMDEIKENDEDERTHVISAVDDWIADGSTFANNQSQTVKKNESKDKNVASYASKNKSVPRKEPGRRSDRGRRTDWKSSTGGKYNAPVKSLEKSMVCDTARMDSERERQMTSDMRRVNIGDYIVRDKTHRRNKDGFETSVKAVSSKSQSKKLVSPPPGFKPIK